MPTYQYSCTDCGHFFEIFQSFSDDSLTVCPECEGRLRKVFNAVGVVFKGSGFYRNDSRAGAGKGSEGGAKSAETSSTKSADTSSGGSSESAKPAAKAPEKSSSSTTPSPA